MASLAPIPRYMKNCINRLRVNCCYSNQGCQEYVPLENLTAHQNACSFRKCQTCGMNSSEVSRLRQKINDLESENASLRDQIDSNSLVDEIGKLNIATSTAPPTRITVRAPRVYDHVVALWGESKWQYFTATVVSYDESKRKYLINWDDKDPTGREIDYKNIALDMSPEENLLKPWSSVIGPCTLYSQPNFL